MRTNTSLSVWLLIVIALAASAAGCDDGAPPAGEDSGADADSDADTDTDSDSVDARTAATPGVETALLGSAHQGFGNPACATCHENAHGKGFQGAECAACHGGNGAPDRPLDHPNDGCAADGCHPAAHADLGFDDANDCRACHRYAASESPDECPSTEEYDAVVIGAGGGGLGAAAALARAGMSVVVLEKNHKLGGCMGTFRRGDYLLEQSLHAMDGLDDGNPNTDAAFKELDIRDRIEAVRGENMYRTFFPDGFELTIPADLEQYKALLIETFPAEEAGINKMIKDVVALDDNMEALKKFNESGNPADLAGVPPAVLAMILSYRDMPASQTVRKYFTDEKLIGVFTQLSGYVGTKPDTIPGLLMLLAWGQYHIHGFWYLKGGSQAVVDALREVIEENGGVIRTYSRVTKIEVDGEGRATIAHTDNGGCYKGRHFVSNANAPDTLFNLVGKDKLPASYVAKVEGLTLGQTGFQLVLGVDRDYTAEFQGAHEIMMVDSFDINDSFQWANAGEVDKIPLSVANYTMLDPGDAPAGKNVIVICSGLPYDFKDEWQWGAGYEDYLKLKNDVAMQLIERVEERLPDLSAHIEVMEMSTPVTVNRYTANPGGSIFGWDNTISQSLDRRLAQQTPIPNLYLASAWTFPAGGQAEVIQSGLGTAKLILAAEEGAK